MNKSGFFLIETILYLLIFSLLIMITLRMSISSISQLARIRIELGTLCATHALLQRFARDISCAPAHYDQWIVIKSDKIIWQVDQKSSGKENIGWMLEKNKLVRKEGIYNFKKETWGKASKGIGAKNIKNLCFEVILDNDQIKKVHIKLEINLLNDQCKTIIGQTFLQNRTVS